VHLPFNAHTFVLQKLPAGRRTDPNAANMPELSFVANTRIPAVVKIDFVEHSPTYPRMKHSTYISNRNTSLFMSTTMIILVTHFKQGSILIEHSRLKVPIPLVTLPTTLPPGSRNYCPNIPIPGEILGCVTSVHLSRIHARGITILNGHMDG
jgi:hypothetical protein